MIEWVLIGGITVAMYIIIYKYEKKMEVMQKAIDENKSRIDKNHKRIDQNHEKIGQNKDRLDEHYNHIEKMWVSSPKHSNKPND